MPLARSFESLYQPEPNTGCWLWLGSLDRNGYGCYAHNNWAAHRISYEKAYGPIPSGLQIDHLCRVSSCVNPKHLEAVIQKENLRRGIHANRNKTHCKHGHELIESNLVPNSHGYRICRACHRQHSKQYQKNRRLNGATCNN